MFGALALSVGWYIKDPISDFFAYFIILVQRPINIGDYIFIDDLTQGVVRKITARSVVLRRRNSTMIIVPNSHIVSRAIHNWNYIRSFVAFDDILITVSYQEDASKVRQLLLKVLDEHARILKNPKPIVRLHDFTDHGYSFLIRGFVSSSYTLDIWDIASEIRLAIVQSFRQEGVSIAVPIRIYTQEQTFARPQSQTKKRDKDE
jgi:small-conductance mechanosensitive channel